MSAQIPSETSTSNHDLLSKMRQSCPPKSFAFIALPPEVRIEIYRYMCLDIHTETCEPSRESSWKCPNKCNTRLLCLSKQVRSEILRFVLGTNYLHFPRQCEKSGLPLSRQYEASINTFQFIHNLGSEKTKYIKRISMSWDLNRDCSPSDIENLLGHLSTAGAKIEELHLRFRFRSPVGYLEKLVIPPEFLKYLPTLRLLTVIKVFRDLLPLVESRMHFESLNTELHKIAMDQGRKLMHTISFLDIFEMENKWEFGDRRLDGTNLSMAEVHHALVHEVSEPFPLASP